MASIHQLPVELLDYIADLSCPEDSMALAFVCRVFNAVATRYAYRHVSLRNRHQKPHSIQLLLRTLLDQPSVGAYVRDLVVEVTDPLNESRLTDPETPNTSDDLRKLASHGLPGIYQPLLNGSISAMLLLLLYHLPALHYLEMNPLMLSNNLLFRRIRDVPALFPALQSLRSVKLAHWNLPSVHWTRMLAPFLDLPKISSIYCLNAAIEGFDQGDDEDDGDGDDGEDSDDSDSDDSDDGDDSDDTSNDDDGNDTDDDEDDGENDSIIYHGVEAIQLEVCVIDAEVLTGLVKSTRRLKSLIYRLDKANPGVAFFPGSFGRALQTHAQDTLENLELDFGVDDMHFVEPPGALGSLRDFTRLKHITAPLSLLLDEPSPGLALDLGVILPRSLTSLSLWIDPDWEEAGWELEFVIVQLLRNKREHVPLLERLHVGGYFDTKLEETIRGACDPGKVDVTFLTNSREPEAQSESQSPSPTTTSPPPAPTTLPNTATPTAISIPNPTPFALNPTIQESIPFISAGIPFPDDTLFSPESDFERDFGAWFSDVPWPAIEEDPGPSWIMGDHANQPGPSSSSYTYDTHYPFPLLPPPPPITSDHNQIFTPIDWSSYIPPSDPPWMIQVPFEGGSTFTSPSAPSPSTSLPPLSTSSQPISSELISVENVIPANESGQSSLD